MDSDPPKKKKKYVVKQQQEKSSESSQPIKQSSGVVSKPFEYSFDHVLNHLLAQLIPN